jgi:hypothetical protein
MCPFQQPRPVSVAECDGLAPATREALTAADRHGSRLESQVVGRCVSRSAATLPSCRKVGEKSFSESPVLRHRLEALAHRWRFP